MDINLDCQVWKIRSFSKLKISALYKTENKKLIELLYLIQKLKFVKFNEHE